ncbi:MAG: hypothetical protein ABH805_00290 [Candidatus Nealsonbacteria bacterium]
MITVDQAIIGQLKISEKTRAIATASIQKIRKTDGPAQTLVNLLKTMVEVEDVSLEILSSDLTRITVIVPNLPISCVLRDNETVRFINHLRNMVVEREEQDPLQWITLTIKRSREDENGYVESTGI